MNDTPPSSSTPGDTPTTPDDAPPPRRRAEDGDDAFALRVDERRIGWLTFDQPGSAVNVLGPDTMEELGRRLDEIEEAAAGGRLAAVVVRSGKEGTFVAGADVHEIARLESAEDARQKSRQGQELFSRVAGLPVPTVAAVDGTCLGGGTELALACDHRVASDRPATKIGLPEVKLGILPAWGGTTRLPRLVGIQDALKVILSGDPVSPNRARRMRLVDAVLPAARFGSELEDFADDVVKGRRSPAGPDRSLTDWLLEANPLGRSVLFRTARKRTRERTGGHYPAPLRALDVIEETCTLPVEDALEEEARALGELAMTPESRNLVRVFLLSQGVKKGLPEEVRRRALEVKRAAVLGAGVMGGEIAEIVASDDVPVILKDIRQDALDEAMDHARGLLDKATRKGVFDESAAGRKFALIRPTLDYDGFGDVDLVVEAVVERMDVKRQVLREAEEALPSRAVFATNTSALSVTELAEAAERPGRVVGLHFFNPAHKMPLVEVVRAEESSEEAVATAFEFALELGKKPVVVADAPGFLVNRLLSPYLNEAIHLLVDGAGIEAVDRALTDFGMPMGPCRLLDEIGLDVAGHVQEEMEAAFGERMRAPGVVEGLVDAGELGKKGGSGFYLYEDGRRRDVNPAMRERLEEQRGPDRHVDGHEIRRRCLYRMVNEAGYALEEGVAGGADDVDVAMIMGTGFPPFRGGLLRWADTEGVAGIAAYLDAAVGRLGDRFTPAPGLRRLADEGGRFTPPPGPGGDAGGR